MTAAPAAASAHADGHAVVVQGPAPADRGAAAAGAAFHAAARPGLAQAARPVTPQPDLGRLLRRLEQHRVAGYVEHAVDLQSGRGDRDRLLARRQQHQAAGVLLIAGPRDPAVGGPGRHAGDDLQPVRVGVLVQHGDLAAAGVHAEDPHGSLVPALHHDQRVVPVLPAGGHQVREGGPVHLDRHAGALERGQVHGHVGVRGAGRGIGHHRGRALGVRGIGDVPPVHGRLVRPGDQQGRAVRGPPVAAHAAHLLGGDELRQAERHAGRAPRVREDPVPHRQPDRPPAARHRRRTPAADRPGPGVDPAPACAWLPRGPAHQPAPHWPGRRPPRHRSAAP